VPDAVSGLCLLERAVTSAAQLAALSQLNSLAGDGIIIHGLSHGLSLQGWAAARMASGGLVTVAACCEDSVPALCSHLA
jgi:hypothetical protein